MKIVDLGDEGVALKFEDEASLRATARNLNEYLKALSTDGEERDDPPYVYGEFEAERLRVGTMNQVLKEIERDELAAKKVYLAHPFKDDPDGNRKRADKIAKTIMSQFPSVLPVSPLHAFRFLEGEDGIREDVMDVCLHLLNSCDQLWYFGKSSGVEREINFAKQNGIAVKQGRFIEDEGLVEVR